MARFCSLCFFALALLSGVFVEAATPSDSLVHSPTSQPIVSWRTQVQRDIEKRILRWLPEGWSIRCSPSNDWSLTVYPNAKRSAHVIMQEIKGKLRSDLTPTQRKALFKRIRHHVMGAIIRTVLLEGKHHNIGVIKLKGRTWTDAKGKQHPLLVFRGAFTQAPLKKGSCVQTLFQYGKVRHLVSLYDSDLLAVEDLRKQERLAAKQAGATYLETRTKGRLYGHWRHALEQKGTFSNPKKLRAVMKKVALLLNEQILHPFGKKPRGNIFFHCGGGMHRSGVLAGVLRRCVNREPMSQIIRLFKYHSAYQSPKQKGGYEPLLIRFIREFDCRLLK